MNNEGTYTALKAANTKLLSRLHLNRDMFLSNSFLRDLPPPPVAPVHYDAEIDLMMNVQEQLMPIYTF